MSESKIAANSDQLIPNALAQTGLVELSFNSLVSYGLCLLQLGYYENLGFVSETIKTLFKLKPDFDGEG
jgi:hypothetical protein